MLAAIGSLLSPAKVAAECFQPLPKLVAWWPAESHLSDVTGYHPESLTSSYAFLTAIVGLGLEFQAAGSIVPSASPPLTHIEDSFTIKFWICQPRRGAVTSQSISSVAGTRDQRYAIAPEHRGCSAPTGVGVLMVASTCTATQRFYFELTFE